MVFGLVASGIGDVVGQSGQAKEIFQRLGGTDGLIDAFMAFAMVIALYGVQAALRIQPAVAARLGNGPVFIDV